MDPKELETKAQEIKDKAQEIKRNLDYLLKTHYGWPNAGLPLGSPTDYGPTADELSSFLATASKLSYFIEFFYMPKVDVELERFAQQQAEMEKQLELAKAAQERGVPAEAAQDRMPG